MKKLNFLSFYMMTIISAILLGCTLTGCGTPVSADTKAPAAVDLTGILIEHNQVTISWAAPTEDDYSHINCYVRMGHNRQCQ